MPCRRGSMSRSWTGVGASRVASSLLKPGAVLSPFSAPKSLVCCPWPVSSLETGLCRLQRAMSASTTSTYPPTTRSSGRPVCATTTQPTTPSLCPRSTARCVRTVAHQSPYVHFCYRHAGSTLGVTWSGLPGQGYQVTPRRAMHDELDQHDHRIRRIWCDLINCWLKPKRTTS